MPALYGSAPSHNAVARDIRVGGMGGRDDGRVRPEDLVMAAGERDVLAAFLDRYRGVVVGKVAGLSDVDARRSLVPSGTSVGGLVKHLRWVETGWFDYLLAQRRGTNKRAHDREWEFRLEPDETLAGIVAQYEAACARSREAAAGFGLDDTVPHHHNGPVALRWIYVHLIEETARHAGHIDILREQLDGSTGFD
jgi:Protein of unknown function (DUF664)